jgi:hypothetical protein
LQNRLSSKESRDESNEIFAILVGALNAAVPVRGQGNVETIVAENVSTAFAVKQQGRRCCDNGPYERQRLSFSYGFANLDRNERVTADSIWESQPSTEGEPEPDGE